MVPFSWLSAVALPALLMPSAVRTRCSAVATRSRYTFGGGAGGDNGGIAGGAGGVGGCPGGNGRLGGMGREGGNGGGGSVGGEESGDGGGRVGLAMLPSLSKRPKVPSGPAEDDCDVMLQGETTSLQRAFNAADSNRAIRSFSLALRSEVDVMAMSRLSAISTDGWPTANVPSMPAREARSAAHSINAVAKWFVAWRESCSAF